MDKMPPAPLLTAAEQDEEVAFQVLNQDNLPIAVIGQPILKPFNTESHKSKPNVIVHPTRRITNNIEDNKQQPFTNSSNNNNNSNNDGKISRKKFCGSHGNLCHNNSTTQMKTEDVTGQIDIEKFSKTLDSKLKRLQKDENKQQKKSNSDPSICKKPFVTTVKKGQFLEPPAEIAFLMGIKVEEQKNIKKNLKEVKKLYAFASQPRVLSRTPPRNVHQTRCEAAAWAADKLVGTVVGVQQEQNIKIRIPLTSTQPQEIRVSKDKNYNSNLDDQVDPNLDSIRIEQAKRRALARKRARHQQLVRPKRGVVSSFATSDILRDRILDIAEFQRLLVAKDHRDAATQTVETSTQETKDFKNLKSDAQIQVHPTDLFDFDTEVQPIVEILVSKTIEEALIEVLEEEELLAMKEQQRRFLEYMAQKTGENQGVEEGLSEKIVENMSRVIKHNYVPSLVTSV